MLLSVVIPAYNEANRIPATLAALGNIAPQLREHLGLDLEIIVVDNASTDGTSDIARSALRRLTIPWAVIPEPIKGKGAAVRTGMLVAKGELRMFMDADNSIPVEQIFTMLQMMDAETAIVIASRALPGSVALVRQPRARKVVSRVSNMIIRATTGIKVRDTQCGFKLFRAEVVPTLFQPLRTVGWGFDVELLARAQAHGFAVKEIPIRWSHRAGSHLNLAGHFSSVRDLLTARRVAKELQSS